MIIQIFRRKLNFCILRAMNHAYEYGEISRALHHQKTGVQYLFLSVINIILLLGNVISPEQSGFISGQYICDNIHFIYN